LPQNPVLLYRLDQWNWRLPSRRVEENRTRAVALLGDRGRRAGKKGKRREGRETRVPFHENQSVFGNRFKYNWTTEPFLSRLYRFGVLGFGWWRGEGGGGGETQAVDGGRARRALNLATINALADAFSRGGRQPE
jgi:hypothetical protein